MTVPEKMEMSFAKPCLAMKIIVRHLRYYFCSNTFLFYFIFSFFFVTKPYVLSNGR